MVMLRTVAPPTPVVKVRRKIDVFLMEVLYNVKIPQNGVALQRRGFGTTWGRLAT